ncbi:uncharacterized protein [Gossypium hirsutum]|uniref:Retrotransposon gag domain-containing protein n=1 Tax=Gossypium hirsutum TaxID=3635 RepID=A0ABM2YN00_GOSHI|nr:uncharacterized protein LOC121205043 [Gossypium hirsutum]
MEGAVDVAEVVHGLGSSSSGHMPAADAPVPQATEVESHDRGARDDALSQAMLRVLERVAGASTGNRIRGSISERLWANGAEIFRGISGVALNVAEYWLEATEQIMDDLDCSVEQKLKGAISLLQDEAYQWWLIVRDGTLTNRVTWELFKMVFKGKYVGASYVDVRRKEFLNLVQEGKTVAEYEAEFLRLSRYTVGIVSTEYESKIAKEVKRTERQNREKDRNRFRRDSGPSGGANRSAKRTRVEKPVRAVAMNVVRPQVCGDSGKYIWASVGDVLVLVSSTDLWSIK